MHMPFFPRPANRSSRDDPTPPRDDSDDEDIDRGLARRDESLHRGATTRPPRSAEYDEFLRTSPAPAPTPEPHARPREVPGTLGGAPHPQRVQTLALGRARARASCRTAPSAGGRRVSCGVARRPSAGTRPHGEN